MAVTMIAFREDGWMSPNTDFRMWDALARSWGADLQMIDQWSEAVVPAGHTLVAVDEDSGVSLSDYVHPADATYVFGRSNLPLIELISPDDSFNIPVADPAVSMFSVSAAAIVLWHRSNQ